MNMLADVMLVMDFRARMLVNYAGCNAQHASLTSVAQVACWQSLVQG
jgi:hypothetical protein